MSTSENIKQLVSRVDKFKNSLFDEEVARRLNSKHLTFKDSNEELKHLANLIAFSQQANSASVEKIISSGKLSNALSNFALDKVAQLNPCDVIEDHWSEIKGIRQQTKIFQIVMIARKMQSNGSITQLLLKSKIPKKINTSNDLEEFWTGFKTLKKGFMLAGVPFFRESTSLLHLLSSLGYDCAKPDSAVMKAAASIKIISSPIRSGDLLTVVRSIQEYSIETNRTIPPNVIDLYFLIRGGQADAKKYVDEKYYA